MDETYEKIKLYIQNIKYDDPYIYAVGFNKETLITCLLFIISILCLFTAIDKHSIMLGIIAFSAFSQKISIIKNGYNNLIEINVKTLYLLLLVYLGHQSILYSVILIILTIPVVKHIIKQKKLKQLNNFYIFEEEGYRGCNMLIKDRVPFEKFNNLVKIKIKLKKEISLKELEDFNNNFLLFTDKIGQVFTGFKCYKNDYEVYLYTYKLDMNVLKKYLDNNINYKYTIEQGKDITFNFYFHGICPSDKLYMHICNEDILKHKLPSNINLYDEQALVLIIAFTEQENAKEFQEHLKSTNEYDMVEYEDNRMYVLSNQVSKKFSHVVYTKQMTRIGLTKLNMITDKMLDTAKSFNGTFEEWAIAKKEEEKES